MNLNDLLHPASVAGPFLVAYGVARLWVGGWARIFRRPVRQVVDLPAYAGWGAWTLSPDAEGRAFLRSAPPLPLDSAIRKVQAAVAKGEREALLTVEEYRAVRSDLYASAPVDGGELTLFGVRLRIETLETAAAPSGHLCDCTGVPHRMEPPCPDYLRLMAGMDRRQWDAMRAAQQRRETPEEAARTRNNSGPPTVFEAEAVLNDMRRREAEYAARNRPSYETAQASARNKPEVLRLTERATETMRQTVDIMAKNAALLLHREHFEERARAAMERHKADKATVEFPDYLPGRYEIHVYKGGERVASTLSEPIPGWRPAPAENARLYSEEDGTW